MVTLPTPDSMPRSAADEGDDGPARAMAGTPGPGAAVAAVAGVLIFGVLGALTGWGIVDTDCSGECAHAAIWGGLAGGAAGAIAAAILAVIVLRARFLWRVPHDQDPENQDPENRDPDDEDPDGDLQPGESLRNGSA